MDHSRALIDGEELARSIALRVMREFRRENAREEAEDAIRALAANERGEDMGRVLVAVCCLALLPAAVSAREATPTPNGTEAMPLPIGAKGIVADTWEVSVVTVYDDVRELDPHATWFTDWLDQYPAPAGQRYLSLRLGMKNVGTKAERPSPSLRFDLVSDTGFTYGMGAGCGSVPGGLPFDAQLDVGDAIEANFCWLVQDRHVPTLRLRASTFDMFEESDGIWFDIVGRAGTATP